MTKVKVFVYGRRRRQRRRPGYDNSSPHFRHGELKIHASDTFMVFYVCVDLPIYKLPPTTQTYLDWASVDSGVHLRCRAGR